MGLQQFSRNENIIAQTQEIASLTNTNLPAGATINIAGNFDFIDCRAIGFMLKLNVAVIANSISFGVVWKSSDSVEYATNSSLVLTTGKQFQTSGRNDVIGRFGRVYVVNTDTNVYTITNAYLMGYSN